MVAQLVAGVAEAVGVAGDNLDDPVGAFGAGVGDPGAQERKDLWPPCLDGCGWALQFGKVGVGASAVEPVQQIADLVPVRRVRAVASRSRRSSLAFHTTVVGAPMALGRLDSRASACR